MLKFPTVVHNSPLLQLSFMRPIKIFTKHFLGGSNISTMSLPRTYNGAKSYVSFVDTFVIIWLAEMFNFLEKKIHF